MNNAVSWVFAVTIAALSILLVLCIGAAVYMTASDDYVCEKTGRQVLVMLPAGKVMVPTMQDETICTKVENSTKS